MHLVNGIYCEKYLRNSGGLRCWLKLFSVRLCNYAVKRGYQGFIEVGGGGGGGGSPGISPQSPNLPPNYF